MKSYGVKYSADVNCWVLRSVATGTTKVISPEEVDKIMTLEIAAIFQEAKAAPLFEIIFSVPR